MKICITLWFIIFYHCFPGNVAHGFSAGHRVKLVHFAQGGAVPMLRGLTVASAELFSRHLTCRALYAADLSDLSKR